MSRTKRWTLVATGVLLVGIGALGVVLPVLPTTIFLLGASWCFARSSPWLERKLQGSRFFAPYLRYLDGDEPMTTRSRVATIAIIWVAITLSLATLNVRDALSAWGAVAIAGAGLVGTVVVWRFRRTRDARPVVSETPPRVADD